MRWVFWHRSDFWLAPKDLDIHNPRNLLSIGTDFGVGPRLEALARHDIHSVRSHDDTRWVSVQRLNPSPIFPGDEESRVYADRVAAREDDGRHLLARMRKNRLVDYCAASRSVTASPRCVIPTLGMHTAMD